MTKDEMKQLWAMLAMYRPKDRRLKDKELKALWFLTFEPYSFEEVRAAVVAHFREHTFFPTPPEISTRCTLPAGAGGHRPDTGAGGTAPQPSRYSPAELRARESREREEMQKYLSTLKEQEGQG